MADTFIVDSSVVIRYPEVLARSARRLVIPDAVLEELRRVSVRGLHNGINNIVEEAIELGAVTAPTPKALKQELLSSDRVVQRLSSTDIAIARVALSRQRVSRQRGQVLSRQRGQVLFCNMRSSQRRNYPVKPIPACT